MRVEKPKKRCLGGMKWYKIPENGSRWRSFALRGDGKIGFLLVLGIEKITNIYGRTKTCRHI